MGKAHSPGPGPAHQARPAFYRPDPAQASIYVSWQHYIHTDIFVSNKARGFNGVVYISTTQQEEIGRRHRLQCKIITTGLRLISHQHRYLNLMEVYDYRNTPTTHNTLAEEDF
jgi:hypothetical protein